MKRRSGWWFVSLKRFSSCSKNLQNQYNYLIYLSMKLVWFFFTKMTTCSLLELQFTEADNSGTIAFIALVERKKGKKNKKKKHIYIQKSKLLSPRQYPLLMTVLSIVAQCLTNEVPIILYLIMQSTEPDVKPLDNVPQNWQHEITEPCKVVDTGVGSHRVTKQRENTLGKHVRNAEPGEKIEYNRA